MARHVLHDERKACACALSKIFISRSHKKELPQVFWQHLPHQLISASLLRHKLPLTSTRAVRQLHRHHTRLHELQHVACACNQFCLLDTFELFQAQAV
jgi:hypothetical protein